MLVVGGRAPNVFHEMVGFVFSHILVQCCLVSDLTSSKPARWLLPPHKVIAIISGLFMYWAKDKYSKSLTNLPSTFNRHWLKFFLYVNFLGCSVLNVPGPRHNLSWLHMVSKCLSVMISIGFCPSWATHLYIFPNSKASFGFIHSCQDHRLSNNREFIMSDATSLFHILLLVIVAVVKPSTLKLRFMN